MKSEDKIDHCSYTHKLSSCEINIQHVLFLNTLGRQKHK